MTGWRRPRETSLRNFFIVLAVYAAVLVLVTVAWNGRVWGWW